MMSTYVTAFHFRLLGVQPFVPRLHRTVVRGLRNYDSITICHHFGDNRHPVILLSLTNGSVSRS